ncbi:unnamed protein product [Pieris macdunnoughi]|uniref:Roadblock/LAMTOR2 domain-containing protein n=1 Tax=Pieris macdunnoughi TaxID=345717 RepID=A0A821SHN6_9NEOP|nr:unnamed protein product [Pieris macdunnoughi]
MIGINKGVYKILKEEYGLQHLILVKCICHSLQLAVAHAFEETIPRNIEFILRETYNWFSMSATRRQEYADIFAAINCGQQPLKILQKCATRWLSIEAVVQRILDQWQELKLFFEIARTKNNCYTAELLHNSYKDPQNKVYLMYIKSILGQVQSALKAFEGENTDPTKLIQTLIKLLESLCDQVVIPGRRPSFNIFEGNVATEVEETIKRIQAHKGVMGVVIVNHEGIPIKTSLDNATSVLYSGLISQLTEKARNVVREMDSTNELTFLRVRSRRHEILIAPDREFILIVIQNTSD